MPKPFAELSFLTRNVQPFEYTRNGVTFKLLIDIDAFTSEYFRTVRKRSRDRIALLSEEDRVARQKFLGELLEAEKEKLQAKEAEKPEVEAASVSPELTIEALEKRLNLPALVDPDAATLHLEIEAKALETKKSILIELLRGDLDDEHPDGDEGSGVLVGWEIPNVEIKCTRESLMVIPTRGLIDLWEFVSDKAHTVKKNQDKRPETSPTTNAGLQASQSNGQIM